MADRRKTNPKQKAKACKMLRDGRSVMEVHRETGLSRVTLYKWAKELEIETQAKLDAPRSRKFDRDAIREMMETEAVETVCEEFGCSRSYAYMCASGELE